MKHGSKVISHCPVLDDLTVAEPEAVGVVKLNVLTGCCNRSDLRGLGAGHPHPCNDALAFRDKHLDLGSKIRD